MMVALLLLLRQCLPHHCWHLPWEETPWAQ